MTSEKYNLTAQYIAVSILKQPNRSIQPQEKLITSGLIDSFHLVDLSIFIEDAFGVLIDDTELNANTFDTLEQLIEIVNARSS